MPQTIPLARPHITDADRAAVQRVLSGSSLSLGPAMREFEAAFQQRLGQPCVAVSSGTAALHLGLLASDIGPGDEVITSAYSVPASVNPVLGVGAKPVFVDICPTTRALDPDHVEAAITDQTRAIMAIHPQSDMADMARLESIAKSHDLILFEDACEALGAASSEGVAGTLGKWAAFGFYPNKQITTGEGGIFTSADDTLITAVSRLRNHGRSMDGRWLDQDAIGYNYRLSDMAAALGCSQMSRLDAIVERRQYLAACYDERIAELPGVGLPPRCVSSSWFCYVVRIPADIRDTVVERMAAANIQCGRYFAPLHQQPALSASLPHVHLPVTETVAQESLALPFFENLTTEQIDRVCQALKNALA